MATKLNLARIPLAIALGAVIFGCEGGDGQAYAVIGKSASGEYWLEVKRAAQKKADELGVKLIFVGASSEVDIAGQIDLVDRMVARKVVGIAISPADSAALSPAIKNAVAAGIKVVTIDSDTSATDRLCYIGTNNEAAGEVAGREMLRLLGGKKGKVATISGVVGAKNLRDRVRGFQKVLRGQADLLMPEMDDGDKDHAMAIATRNLGAHPDLSAFFTVTALAGPATAVALENAGRVGQVKVVAFDTTPSLIKQLKAGRIQVLIAQRPDHMGEWGVERLVAAVKGEKLPSFIDTGVDVVTRENVGKFD